MPAGSSSLGRAGLGVRRPKVRRALHDPEADGAVVLYHPPEETAEQASKSLGEKKPVHGGWVGGGSLSLSLSLSLSRFLSLSACLSACLSVCQSHMHVHMAVTVQWLSTRFLAPSFARIRLRVCSFFGTRSRGKISQTLMVASWLMKWFEPSPVRFTGLLLFFFMLWCCPSTYF